MSINMEEKNTEKEPLIRVENLKKYYPIRGGVITHTTGYVHSVDGVSFSIAEGETLGLVGESGCGKTTVGRTILQLYKPTAGEIIYDGKPVKTKADLQKFRTKATMVFQDPYSSLNPRMTVSDIVGEPLDVHHLYSSKKEREERILQLLGYVGLNSEHASRYAHEFSGGQRQRIGVARALALDPKLVVCDEPVSALDVSIQAQILNLMRELQRKYQLTYIFISHNLSVVKHICDRIAVMYLGNIVEIAPKKELFDNPLHPYTKALLGAIPIPDPDIPAMQDMLEGDVPSPINPPKGCCFHTRCHGCCKECTAQKPKLINVGNDHWVACCKV